jgi:DNA-binding transcriptional LysR family regulator
MDLALLNIFVEVVRRGSYAEVARLRGVTPSAVSRSVTSLEDELGVRLLHRSTRKMTPTEAGQAYFERVQGLVDELEDANQIAADYRDRPTGRIRITTPVTFGQLCIVPLLPVIARTYPDISFDVLITDVVVDLLAERIDLAVRLGTLPDSGLVAKRLCPMDYAVCASPAYLAKNGAPTTPAELQHHSCVVLPLSGYNSGWIFRARDGATTKVPLTGKYALSNASAVRDCAIAGMGVTLLPLWVAADAIDRRELVKVLPDYQVTPHEFDAAAWLVYPSRHHVPRKVRVLLGFLLDRFKEYPPWGWQTSQRRSAVA